MRKFSGTLDKHCAKDFKYYLSSSLSVYRTKEWRKVDTPPVFLFFDEVNDKLYEVDKQNCSKKVVEDDCEPVDECDRGNNCSNEVVNVSVVSPVGVTKIPLLDCGAKVDECTFVELDDNYIKEDYIYFDPCYYKPGQSAVLIYRVKDLKVTHVITVSDEVFVGAKLDRAESVELVAGTSSVVEFTDVPYNNGDKDLKEKVKDDTVDSYNTLTAPLDGLYSITSNLTFGEATADTAVSVTILVNGLPVAVQSGGVSFALSPSASLSVSYKGKLKKGDKVTVSALTVNSDLTLSASPGFLALTHEGPAPCS